jgi:hypothetical protein
MYGGSEVKILPTKSTVRGKIKTIHFITQRDGVVEEITKLFATTLMFQNQNKN